MNLKLKLQIVKKGWTQRALASRIGMTEDRLSDIVRGQEATAVERAALAQELSATAEALFGPTSAAVIADPIGTRLRSIPGVINALRDVANSAASSEDERQAAALLVASIERKYGLSAFPETRQKTPTEG